MSEYTNTTRTWRPRLSLLSAILLMTIAGMSIVLVQLWREVGPLRADNRRLRDEVGELTISDLTKIHAIEVRMQVPLIWKFRVWVPEGQKAIVKARWGDVPRTGVPIATAGVTLEPGEQWVMYRVIESIDGKSWGAQLESASGGSGASIQEKDRWWQWPEPAAVWGEGIHETTASPGDEDDLFISSVRL